MALPHIKNSQAGVNLYDPVNKSIFEVYFTLPEAIRAEFGKDEVLISEHVQKISGLDALYKAPEADVQKFMGTSRSYLKPTVGDTHADLEVEFSLNLRNGTDNYILKLFRAWAALGYDISSGQASRLTVRPITLAERVERYTACCVGTSTQTITNFSTTFRCTALLRQWTAPLTLCCWIMLQAS